jgi:hypothetical protein
MHDNFNLHEVIFLKHIHILGDSLIFDIIEQINFKVGYEMVKI